MKRSDSIPLLLVVPLLAFVTVQAARRGQVAISSGSAIVAPALTLPARRERHPALTSAVARGRVSDAAGRDVTTADARDAAPRDAESVRARLRAGAAGTYMNELLLARDSNIARWRERVANPVRVFIASGANVPGWRPEDAERLRQAFQRWEAVGVPVRFTFVLDSAQADVTVRWIDHFTDPISGKTLWSRDRQWWILNGTVTIALRHNQGQLLDDRAIYAIGLHEVGHLLGLDHTADTTNIMTARVRVRELSAADSGTMRLLYSVPAGSVK